MEERPVEIKMSDYEELTEIFSDIRPLLKQFCLKAAYILHNSRIEDQNPLCLYLIMLMECVLPTNIAATNVESMAKTMGEMEILMNYHKPLSGLTKDELVHFTEQTNIFDPKRIPLDSNTMKKVLGMIGHSVL